MNYIELDLGGEKRGFKLGLGFLRYLDENANIKVKDFDSIITGQEIVKYPTLVYHSLAYNELRAKREFKHDIYDVCDWIDEKGGLNGEFMIEFSSALIKSMNIDLGKNQPEKKPAKK